MPHRGAQLDIDVIMRRAQTVAGLTDFGDRWFLAPLGQLINAINDEAGLLSADSMPVERIVYALVDRLRLIQTLNEQPTILDEQIDVAGVIIGLPRTGSTILQRILTSSPQLTSGYWWEVTLPLPLPGEQPGDPRPRHVLAKKLVAEFLANWPDFISIDPMDAMAVAEEVILLDKSFLSTSYDSMFNIPSYGYWMSEADHSRAYQELRIWLQVLQSQTPKRRERKWILKTPHHLLGGLDGLLETFADSKIIMTHRAIEDVLPSYCSMCTSFTAPFSSTFDKPTYGAHWAKRFRDALHKLIAVRAGPTRARFIDVQYHDTITHPIDVGARVMGAMGLTFTATDEAAIGDCLKDNERDKRPPHRYTAEEFGLTRTSVAADFRFYSDLYTPTPAAEPPV